MSYDSENWKPYKYGKDYVYIGEKIIDYRSINCELCKLISNFYMKPLKQIETNIDYSKNGLQLNKVIHSILNEISVSKSLFWLDVNNMSKLIESYITQFQIDKVSENGKHREIYSISISNGLKDGEYKQYYIQTDETTSLKKELLLVEAVYKNGKLDGKCKIWYPFGEARVIKEITYIDGVSVSTK